MTDGTGNAQAASAPSTKSKAPQSPARKATGRALLACGGLFALLLLLGLSGLASVTLFYIEQDAGTGYGDLEGVVIRCVKFVDGWTSSSRLHLIGHFHAWGSYAALVMCGWSVVELWSAAGMLKIHAEADVRSNARFMRPLAAIGGVILVLAIVLQLIAGTATRRALDEMRAPTAMDQPASRDESARIVETLSTLQGEASQQSKDEVVVTVHMRELNYPLGLGALLILVAVMLARRAAIILDAESKREVDKAQSHKQA